ncbi:ester cyclase [Galbibacter pacificus]|uniref:Ester cyclase n=1 Tax=Galbibacter pacificus TaxID=2996052 RepID=A0ABT6FRW8_9FLAO|nr:ester cyclase [Galbibacter pacificus]MDG3582858.1 ester cyclase [Galbibacter pacificus]MDG3586023.1 ester cyclase [Galbibacter pacificus]
MSTVDKNKASVLKFNKEFLEQGNFEVLDEIIADDFINNTAPKGVPNNIDGLKQVASMLHKGFSHFDIEILEQIGEDDIIATRKMIHVIHTGEIMGHKPTNKSVTFNVMDFVRLRDGKYVEHWGQNDIMEIIEKL